MSEGGGGSPVRERPSQGIALIEDITSPTSCPGVDTPEGRIGPLLIGQGCQTYYVEVPAGSYAVEEVHPRGAIVYTAKGNWVLCSGGARHLMRPGSLFMYEDGTPVGVEVPFDESAFLLTFRDTRSIESDVQFFTALHKFNERQEKTGGKARRLKDLPEDHPAVVFGRYVISTGKAVPEG